jgi:hypothetical protein
VNSDHFFKTVEVVWVQCLGAMNNIREPAEPKRELVECAIVELLSIAERQGITASDFVQLLDSGMQISDLLAAMKLLVNGNRIVECN